ncbi:hypothetical protein [Streptomyces sp. NPDC016845]|uniref:hypothetical protein n=1 Tax=Streptomyces sp. NPDC016845 TaxID=3364972 RepID=UPI00379D4662
MTDIENIKVGDRNALDLDRRSLSDEDSPASGSDFLLNFGRIYHGEDNGVSDKSMGVIDDSMVPRCATRSQKNADILFLDEMGENQSICVETSEGRWVLMQIVAADASRSDLGVGAVTFRVGYLKNPS